MLPTKFSARQGDATCVVAPDGWGRKRIPSPRPSQSAPRLRSTDAILRVCDARKNEAMLCGCANGMLQGLKGHDERGFRVGQRAVGICPQRYRH